MERNLCIESGCRACCCRDMFFYDNGFTPEKIREYWPSAQEVRFFSIPELLNKPGVYFIKEGSRFVVRVSGVCPNVEGDFSCRLRENRPDACLNFELGQDPCTAARSRNGLDTYQEWVFAHQTSVSG